MATESGVGGPTSVIQYRLPYLGRSCRSVCRDLRPDQPWCTTSSMVYFRRLGPSPEVAVGPAGCLQAASCLPGAALHWFRFPFWESEGGCRGEAVSLAAWHPFRYIRYIRYSIMSRLLRSCLLCALCALLCLCIMSMFGTCSYVVAARVCAAYVRLLCPHVCMFACGRFR